MNSYLRIKAPLISVFGVLFYFQNKLKVTHCFLKIVTLSPEKYEKRYKLYPPIRKNLTFLDFTV
jgi:hypothetical protein